MKRPNVETSKRSGGGHPARRRVQGEQALKERAQRVAGTLWVRRGRGMRPLTAAELAECLDLRGSREYVRRLVREIVTHLRDEGERICASVTDGYWLARDLTEWRAYEEAVRRQVLFVFVAQRIRRNKRIDQRGGQKTLFQTSKSPNVETSKRRREKVRR